MGGAIPIHVGLSYIRKVPEQATRSMLVCSVPPWALVQFLPGVSTLVPLLMGCNLSNKPFPPEVRLVMVLSTTRESKLGFVEWLFLIVPFHVVIYSTGYLKHLKQ